jgi:hypothetical protein
VNMIIGVAGVFLALVVLAALIAGH